MAVASRPDHLLFGQDIKGILGASGCSKTKIVKRKFEDQADNAGNEDAAADQADVATQQHAASSLPQASAAADAALAEGGGGDEGAAAAAASLPGKASGGGGRKGKPSREGERWGGGVAEPDAD